MTESVKKTKKRSIVLNLPESVIAELDRLSNFKGVTRTSLLREAIDDYLANEKKKGL